MRPSRGTPTIGVMMIVRDEAENLPRLARSLDRQIDHWTIVDTGSTDDTIAVAQEVFRGVPGEVLTSEWLGFGPSRNIALEAARPHTDWLLRMDGDETLVGKINRWDLPGVGAAEVQVRWPPEVNWIPRLLRSDLPWTWRGRTRELITGPETYLMKRMAEFHIEHHALRVDNPAKNQRDIQFLKMDLAEDPEDSRSMFYLARTYMNMGQYGSATAWFLKRLGVEGYAEEDWYAHLCLGVCHLQTGMVELGRTMLMNAWKARQYRPEPLVVLARHYETLEDWEACLKVCKQVEQYCRKGTGNDRLFLNPSLLDGMTELRLKAMAELV